MDSFPRCWTCKDGFFEDAQHIAPFCCCCLHSQRSLDTFNVSCNPVLSNKWHISHLKPWKLSRKKHKVATSILSNGLCATTRSKCYFVQYSILVNDQIPVKLTIPVSLGCAFFQCQLANVSMSTQYDVKCGSYKLLWSACWHCYWVCKHADVTIFFFFFFSALLFVSSAAKRGRRLPLQ